MWCLCRSRAVPKRGCFWPHPIRHLARSISCPAFRHGVGIWTGKLALRHHSGDLSTVSTLHAPWRAFTCSENAHAGVFSCGVWGLVVRPAAVGGHDFESNPGAPQKNQRMPLTPWVNQVSNSMFGQNDDHAEPPKAQTLNSTS